MKISDALRQRAQELRDNPDGWKQGEPDQPGSMCAVYNYGHSTAIKAVHNKAIEAMERWLPAYVISVFGSEEYAGFGDKTRLDLTYFNDTIATDVHDVITAMEKCAAELG